jgi:hypothetical protein
VIPSAGVSSIAKTTGANRQSGIVLICALIRLSAIRRMRTSSRGPVTLQLTHSGSGKAELFVVDHKPESIGIGSIRKP